MVCSHRCGAEEGTTTPLLPQAPEEIWNESPHPALILHLHCGKLPGCITAWFGKQHQQQLQRVVRTAHHTVGGELPSLQDIYTRRCMRKSRRIISDSNHLSHGLFSLLPSGRWLRSIRTCTSRLRDSFFPQTGTDTYTAHLSVHTIHHALLTPPPQFIYIFFFY